MPESDEIFTVRTAEHLHALYGAPVPASIIKETDRLHPLYAAFVKASPFVVLATNGPGARTRWSPVWALLKRQIVGIHYWVSDKHLDHYVQEMTFRWNHRADTVTDRMNGLFACVEGRLTYKALIA